MKKIEISAKQEEKFWKKVIKGEAGNCWLWTGSTIHNGYGRFGGGSDKYLAHRVSWTLANGDITEGKVLNHICRNRLCVNPAHLEETTNRENVLLGVGPTAIHARKTHCIAGHEFTEQNTRIITTVFGINKDRRGKGRICKECAKRYSRTSYIKSRQAA